METPGFRITSGKGFHVTFANGWTVSVQFGYGNYCENRDFNKSGVRSGDSWAENDKAAGEAGCPNAEIAAWPQGGSLIPIADSGDTVRGWVTPDEFLAFMNDIASRPAAVPEEVPA